MEPNTALFFRRFSPRDMEILQKRFLPGYSVDKVLKTLDLWDTRQCNQLPFDIFAIMVNTTVVGRICLYLEANFSNIRLKPEILPEFRRKGYGSLAVVQAYELVRRYEFPSVSMNISPDDEGAIAFATSLGFKPESTIKNPEGKRLCIYKLYY